MLSKVVQQKIGTDRALGRISSVRHAGQDSSQEWQQQQQPADIYSCCGSCSSSCSCSLWLIAVHFEPSFSINTAQQAEQLQLQLQLRLQVRQWKLPGCMPLPLPLPQLQLQLQLRLWLEETRRIKRSHDFLVAAE